MITTAVIFIWGSVYCLKIHQLDACILLEIVFLPPIFFSPSQEQEGELNLEEDKSDHNNNKKFRSLKD